MNIIIEIKIDKENLLMINKKINISLLNEIKMEQVLPRFQSPKFLEAQNKYDNVIFGRRIEKFVESMLKSIIPDDIQEKHKAEALNWLITRFLENTKAIPISDNEKLPVYHLNDFAPETKTFLETFYQIKEQNIANILLKKDINQIQSVQELKAIVQEAKPAYEEYKQRKLLKNPEQGINKIYEDKDWSAFIPETKAASCFLGKGTSWCTASPTLNFYERTYHKPEIGSPLIIFINRHEPEKKYQLSFHSEDFANKDNQQINKAMLMRFCLMIRDRMHDLPEFVRNKAKEKIESASSGKFTENKFSLDENNMLSFTSRDKNSPFSDDVGVVMIKFYDLDGLYHRDEKDGPAVTYITTYAFQKTKVETYHTHGVISRMDGPALIRTESMKDDTGNDVWKVSKVIEEYYLDSNRLSKEEWEKQKNMTPQERDSPFLEENKKIKLRLLKNKGTNE